MEDFDTLAVDAEAELRAAKQQCIDSAYDDSSQAALWNVFRHWVSHPKFDKDFNILEANILEATVLNELEFTLSDPHLKNEGWSLISELAARWERENNIKMKESLRIASFEIAAEPPEYAPTLELLFSLAPNPETRWAVFSAYENYPWRLRPHARKYSGGFVTDQDCDEWLISRGYSEDEFLMNHQHSDKTLPPTPSRGVAAS